jgi:hypothetical protein
MNTNGWRHGQAVCFIVEGKAELRSEHADVVGENWSVDSQDVVLLVLHFLQQAGDIVPYAAQQAFKLIWSCIGVDSSE